MPLQMSRDGGNALIQPLLKPSLPKLDFHGPANAFPLGRAHNLVDAPVGDDFNIAIRQ